MGAACLLAHIGSSIQSEERGGENEKFVAFPWFLLISSLSIILLASSTILSWYLSKISWGTAFSITMNPYLWKLSIPFWTVSKSVSPDARFASDRGTRHASLFWGGMGGLDFLDFFFGRRFSFGRHCEGCSCTKCWLSRADGTEWIAQRQNFPSKIGVCWEFKIFPIQQSKVFTESRFFEFWEPYKGDFQIRKRRW